MATIGTTRLRRLLPRKWGIATRSAIVAATVVLVALVIAGTGLTVLLSRVLVSAVDAAATERLYDITTDLKTRGAENLDSALFSTDQSVVAVQVIAADGSVVHRSPRAPDTPLIPLDRLTTTPASGIAADSPAGDMRISGQRIQTPRGDYTVLVGGGSDIARTNVKTVALLLCGSSPVVIVVVALATYLLVKRSLRSVDAIRARVAEISTSDLTERVPVPDSRDEISALAVTMNAMLARLEAGHNAQRQFVGDASHELRSPLATIISALHVALAHPELLDQDLAETTLMPEAQRMQSLIEDLLLLARADERGLKLRRDDIDLAAVAEAETCRLTRDTTLRIDSDLAPAPVIGDSRALSRMLRNLMDNAARHAASRISVGVRREASSAVVTVADDGPGIPEHDRQRVFDRFVRLDSDRARSGGGTGLGLAIVAEIVAAHQGTITIGDRHGGGTTVRVQLPARRSSVAAQHSSASSR